MSPVLIAVVAPGTLTTAGTPYSRATSAACESGPPSSVTTRGRHQEERREPDVGGARHQDFAGHELRRPRARRLEHARADLRPRRRWPAARAARARAGGKHERRRPTDEAHRRIGTRLRRARTRRGACDELADVGAPARQRAS